MKKVYLLSIFFILCLGIKHTLQAQSCTNKRYIDPIFSINESSEHDIFATVDAPLYPPFVSDATTYSRDLYFDLYRPQLGTDTLTKRPLIVMVFGGAFLVGFKEQPQLVDFCRYFAERGYVCAAIDYRLGFNALDTESAVRAVYRGAQDTKAAIRYFKENASIYNIDTNYVFAGGNSAGGISAIHATYVTEADRTASSLLAATYCCTDFFGTWPDLGCTECSGNSFNHDGAADVVINLWGAIGELAWLNSPTQAPLISFHGDADFIVDPNSGAPFSADALFPSLNGSFVMHSQATAAGIHNELHAMAGEGHEPWFFSAQALYIQENTRDFLYEFMKPALPIVTGSTTVCANSTETYTVPLTTGSIYCWDITGGTIISSDTDANTVDIQWNSGVTGTIEVREINCNVVESDLQTVNIGIIPVSTPTALAVSNTTGNSTDLNWSAGTGITYDLQYQEMGSGSTWTTITGLGSNMTTLNALTPCTDYQFRVQEVCGTTTSGYSPSYSFSTNGIIPNNINNTTTTNSANISWDAVGNATFDLQYRPSGSSTWTTINGISGTSNNISGLTPCTQYDYQVQAVCNGTPSGYSAMSAFWTDEIVPTNVSSTFTANSASISWDAVGSATFDLQYRPTGSSTWTTVNGISGTSNTINGLTACTEYEYQVQAICNGATSGYSALSTFLTNVDIPSNINNTINVNSATISWDALGNATFEIRYRAIGESTWNNIYSIAGTSKVIPNLNVCTDYEYEVQAVCNGTPSGYSATNTFSISGSIPLNITSTLTANSASISWASAGNATFELQYRPLGSSTWTTVSGISGTSSSINNLNPCSEYEYRVQAICNGTPSGYSTVSSFVTSCIRLNVKVLLEGAYNGGSMSTGLKSGGLLPLSQPYNTFPWNYGGTENVANATSIPNTATDWIVLELRDATNKNIVLAQVAAFVLSNGDVQGIDGLAGVELPGNINTGSYYIVVRHRNHLDIMSTNPVSLPSATAYDFTSSANQALAGQQVDLGGVFGLYAGDNNGDGIISVYDYNQYSDQTASIGYLESDCTLDGNNTVADFNEYRPNADRIGVREIRY